ncbi:hypothetical protein H7F50_09435 [Novosphingobium flavum]|uniref:hypothetical protein n=1 Tax=Novosphingobium aerophilum TaxID=2839843 RepID=UPI0016399250|nr:hypothetical protein [Novosphingobium aerophilum]MBC2661983.1 hypothetical protein [Novosphingobium aerophilum]
MQGLGYVDGIYDDEIVGWLASPTQPGIQPRIHLCFDNGDRLEWAPTHFRHDVCQAVGRSGIFGFFVPLELVREHGLRCTIRDEAGLELPNGRIDLTGRPIPATRLRTDTCTVYLHIQKVGGTSINNLIHSGIAKSRFVALYPGCGLSLAEFVSLPFGQRAYLDLVIGHTYFGLEKFIGETVRYATLLRDPLQRVRSQVHHVLLNTGPMVPVRGELVPLHRVVNEGLTEEFDNLQVRMVAGLAEAEVACGKVSRDHAELAIYNLAHAFSFAGLFETLRHDQPELNHALGLPDLSLPSLNVTDREALEPFAEELARIDWSRVAGRHQPEQWLYGWLSRQRSQSGALAA